MKDNSVTSALRQYNKIIYKLALKCTNWTFVFNFSLYFYFFWFFILPDFHSLLILVDQ